MTFDVPLLKKPPCALFSFAVLSARPVAPSVAGENPHLRGESGAQWRAERCFEPANANAAEDEAGEDDVMPRRERRRRQRRTPTGSSSRFDRIRNPIAAWWRRLE